MLQDEQFNYDFKVVNYEKQEHARFGLSGGGGGGGGVPPEQ